MPSGRICLCEGALQAFSTAAAASGADLLEDSVVRMDRKAKVVHTEGGTTLRYSKLVLACGPWTNKLLGLANLAKLPIFVSNEQTINFGLKKGKVHNWHNTPVSGYRSYNKEGRLIWFYIAPEVSIAGWKVSQAHDSVRLITHRLYRCRSACTSKARY